MRVVRRARRVNRVMYMLMVGLGLRSRRWWLMGVWCGVDGMGLELELELVEAWVW
jgi:hypothetical protein